MPNQITDSLFMIRPVAFHKNEETAANNFYQQDITNLSADQIQEKARQEFDDFVSKLRAAGIDVTVIEDNKGSSTPDSIFPNNWISLHEDGSVILYPMFAENRRKERRPEILAELSNKFHITASKDLTKWEAQSKYLEGTGSMILDRINEIAYAAVSERTNPQVFEEFCNRQHYTGVQFVANQSIEGQRLPIYHTNVMMCVGEGFALICLDSIDDELEKKSVIESLKSSGKEIIPISEDQNNHFAGNTLQLRNQEGERFVVMSGAAYHSLHEDQVDQLKRHGEIIHSPLDTIEKLGGGSARCMMAEVFLPKKQG